MSEHALIRDPHPIPATSDSLVRHDPHPPEELIMHLEPDQLVTETFRPVARAVLGRPAMVGLWALRVFCVLVSLMVIYTFIVRLH